MQTVDLAEGRDRLKAAVGCGSALSRQGILEHLFAWMFKGLVYPQIWEDPEIDLEALAITPQSHVVAIASGGCNILSYLIADPQRITAVDLNKTHVALLAVHSDGSVTYGHGWYMPLEGWQCWKSEPYTAPTHWFPLPDPFGFDGVSPRIAGRSPNPLPNPDNQMPGGRVK